MATERHGCSSSSCCRRTSSRRSSSSTSSVARFTSAFGARSSSSPTSGPNRAGRLYKSAPAIRHTTAMPHAVRQLGARGPSVSAPGCWFSSKSDARATTSMTRSASRISECVIAETLLAARTAIPVFFAKGSGGIRPWAHRMLARPSSIEDRARMGRRLGCQPESANWRTR